MGGRSSSAKRTDASAAAAQAAQTRMAQQLFNQSAPARAMLFQQGQDFLSGDYDVTANPMYGMGKTAIEDQFANAQDYAIQNLPEGGGLSQTLAGVAGQRARSFGDLTSGIAQQQMNQITGLATGGAVQGSNVMGQAANIAAQRAQAAASNDAGKSSGAGSAAGRIGAAAVTKSDRRLKSNIRQIGYYKHYPLYAYNIDGKPGVGVMADEVPAEYTSIDDSGFLSVDYARL